jgi:hypothetical protein
MKTHETQILGGKNNTVRVIFGEACDKKTDDPMSNQEEMTGEKTWLALGDSSDRRNNRSGFAACQTVACRYFGFWIERRNHHDWPGSLRPIEM